MLASWLMPILDTLMWNPLDAREVFIDPLVFSRNLGPFLVTAKA